MLTRNLHGGGGIRGGFLRIFCFGLDGLNFRERDAAIFAFDLRLEREGVSAAGEFGSGHVQFDGRVGAFDRDIYFLHLVEGSMADDLELERFGEFVVADNLDGDDDFSGGVCLERFAFASLDDDGRTLGGVDGDGEVAREAGLHAGIALLYVPDIPRDGTGASFACDSRAVHGGFAENGDGTGPVCRGVAGFDQQHRAVLTFGNLRGARGDSGGQALYGEINRASEAIAAEGEHAYRQHAAFAHEHRGDRCALRIFLRRHTGLRQRDEAEVVRFLADDDAVNQVRRRTRVAEEVAQTEAIRGIFAGFQTVGDVARGSVEIRAAEVRVVRGKLLQIAGHFEAFGVTRHALKQREGRGGQTESMRDDLDPIHIALLRIEAVPIHIAAGEELAGQFAGRVDFLRLLRPIVRLILDGDGPAGETDERRIGDALRRLELILDAVQHRGIGRRTECLCGGGQINVDHELIERFAFTGTQRAGRAAGQVAAIHSVFRARAGQAGGRHHEINVRRGADAEPVEILAAAAIEEVVRLDGVHAVGRCGEIQDAPLAVALNLAAVRIKHSEHRVHPRIDRLRGAAQDEALAFLGGEPEIIHAVRIGGRVDDGADSDFVRVGGDVVAGFLQRFDLVADGEGAGIRDAVTTDDTGFVTAGRDGRADVDDEFAGLRLAVRAHLGSAGDAGV